MKNHSPPELVRDELARILASPDFTATPRRRKMLHYIVEEMLAGRGEAIKGYTIGIDVFGRDPEFDADADPVVRLEAGRLRRDLGGYYATEGRNNPMRISIPKGRYVPKIDVRSVMSAEAPDAALAGAVVFASGRRWYFAAALAGIVALAGLGMAASGNWSGSNTISDASIQTPAIAVFPFEVLSRKEEDRYLATGISNLVVAELNRFPDIRIYFPGTDSGSHSNSDLVALGSRLGVSYVVTGSLRSDGPFAEVSARLINVQTGQIVWTNSYNRPLDPGSLFAIQGEIAADIASAIGQPYGVIRNEITARLSKEFVPSMPGYECVLRAYHYRRVLPGDELAGPVMDCLQRAVVENPEYPEAWALLGFVHLDSVRFHRVSPSLAQSTLQTALDAASRAIALDPKNITGLQALAAINFYQGHYENSERIIRIALEQNLNDPETMIQAGWRMAVRGKFEEGIPLMERAIARTVSPPGWYYHMIAIDRLMKRDGTGMLEAAQKSTLNGAAFSYSLLAMAHGMLGDRNAALQALNRMNEIRPDFDPMKVYHTNKASDEIIEAATAALHRAGWPGAVQQE